MRRSGGTGHVSPASLEGGRPPRVLLVSTAAATVPPHHYGGVERIVAELAAGLRRRDRPVALLALRGSDVPGVEVRFWRRRKAMPQALDYGLQILACARAFSADLVHSFGETKWLVPWLATGGSTVVSYQVRPRPRAARVLRLGRGRLSLVACSESLRDAAAEIVPGPWSVVYNGVDPTKYLAAREVPLDAPLVFLSRIDPIKGTHLAIEVALQSGRKIVVAGNRAADGPSWAYWRDVVAPLVGAPGVEYVGPVDDREKNGLLGRAAAMIVPVQWDEPFGIVFVEALACGTPVLSTARGALPEIVRHGTEGFLGSGVQELAGFVPRLSEIDRRACRLRVEEHFSADRTVEGYLELYDELLATRSRGRRVGPLVTGE